MADNVKLEQPATNGALRFLQSELNTRTLAAIGEQTKKHLTNNWLDGRGGDGTQFKTFPNTNKYIRRKQNGKVYVADDEKYHSGAGKIDMMLTGQMQRGLTKRKQGQNKVVVTFFKKQQNKAIWNATKRPNLMLIDDDFIKKATDYYEKKMKSAIKRGKV